MNWKLLAILLGLLLVAAPVLRVHADQDESDEYGEEEAEESAGGEARDDPDVVVLDDTNFDELIKSKKFALVEFYAPWCGHCQKLKPEYAKAATRLKAAAPNALIAKLDATVATAVAGRFKVEGYPTLKWFVDGEVAMDYAGGRDEEGIVKWVSKRSGPPALTLSSADDLAELEQSEAVVVVGYFKEFKGDVFEAFLKSASASEDGVFAQTTDAAAGQAAGLTAEGVAVVTNFKGEERAAVAVVGEVTSEAINSLLLANKLPPTIEFNDQNSQKIFNSGIEKQLLLIASPEDLEASAAVFTAFRTVAKSHKGKLVFVTVDAEGPSKDPVLNFFGVTADEAPVIVGFEMGKNRKYRYAGEMTEEGIATFAVSLIDGSAQPQYKSAPIPESPKDAEVTVVVGKNFDAIVKDPTKDVLLEVYAPWCGHCKSLAPIYTKLAKRFKKVESIVIAKMDGTENEHADVDVKGFPTLIFYPAGEDKVAVPYEGERTLKGFTKWLKKNAKISYELPKKSGSEESDEHDEL